MGDDLTAVVRETFRQLAAEAPRSSLKAAVLATLADHAAGATAAEVDALSRRLVGLIEGNPNAAIHLYNFGLDVYTLSTLTTALQHAEAEDKAEAHEWARLVGSLLGDLLPILVKAVIKAVIKGG